MIYPKDEVPLDDSDETDKEDQVSQQDIHSTGVEPDPAELEKGKETDADILKESYDASEAAYTLKTGEDASKSKPGQKK
ncbi:MAG TPA: hypothetical protein VHB54_02105 [Mucilaginibacter sp.]|nr:hypothetical protein [Mucilaginibacter sp.]